MTRHQWLDLHFWIVVAFAAVIIIHILLHWDWIKGYIKSVTKPASSV